MVITTVNINPNGSLELTPDEVSYAHQTLELWDKQLIAATIPLLLKNEAVEHVQKAS